MIGMDLVRGLMINEGGGGNSCMFCVHIRQCHEHIKGLIEDIQTWKYDIFFFYNQECNTPNGAGSTS